MTEETYPPKIFRPKHTRISELKAEAVKKDRRKKLTQSKFVGGAENTAHPRVISAPEVRQESEQVSLTDLQALHTCYTKYMTGTKGERSLGATSWNEILRRPSGPQHPGPHILRVEVLSPRVLPRVSPLPSSHRAPAADTWRLPFRSSKPAHAWCLVLCTCPTATAKGSTRESRYAPIPRAQVQRAPEGGICQKTFTCKCLRFLSSTIVFPEPPVSTPVPQSGFSPFPPVL